METLTNMDNDGLNRPSGQEKHTAWQHGCLYQFTGNYGARQKCGADRHGAVLTCPVCSVSSLLIKYMRKNLQRKREQWKHRVENNKMTIQWHYNYNFIGNVNLFPIALGLVCSVKWSLFSKLVFAHFSKHIPAPCHTWKEKTHPE